MRRTVTTLFAPALALLLSGCIPPPADIGVDYSGPLPRRPGADAPRVVTNKPVLPVMVESECAPITEVPTRRRSECGVRQTMARNNNGLQMLYQRRLTEVASLRGAVVLRMNIAPDGSVQAVDIASSDINDEELGRQITAYVRTIAFGSLENVPAWADTYTIEFAPPKEAGANDASEVINGEKVRSASGVRAVFERNDGLFQAIYKRELQANPRLKGTLVLRMVITPDGTVTACDVVSSELKDLDIEKRMTGQVQALNFGALAGVPAWTGNHTLTFSPK